MKLKQEKPDNARGGVEVSFEIGGPGVNVMAYGKYPGLNIEWVDVPILIGMLRKAQEEDGRTVS